MFSSRNLKTAVPPKFLKKEPKIKCAGTSSSLNARRNTESYIRYFLEDWINERLGVLFFAQSFTKAADRCWVRLNAYPVEPLTKPPEVPMLMTWLLCVVGKLKSVIGITPNS